MYEDDFQKALERTKRMGLPLPEVIFESTRYLTTEAMEGLNTAIFDALGPMRTEQLAGQCLAIHLQIQDIVSTALGCPVYYTIGWVELEKGSWFEHSEETLRTLMTEGLQHDRVQLHAWLTLPSMEIVDVSLMTTYALVREYPEAKGKVIATHPCDLTGGVMYKPTLVGAEFLARSGIMRAELITHPGP